MKKASFYLIFVLAYSLAISSFGYSRTSKSPHKMNADIALKWAKATMVFTNMQTTKSPTFISRCLGYTGITMYEAVVHSNNKYQSVVGQLSGLREIPTPEKDKEYDWELVLNASQSKILRLLWQPEKAMYGFYSLNLIDSLENAVLNQKRLSLQNEKVLERSVKFGIELANAIYEWSKSDGGHEMNFKNFDPTYKYSMDIQHGQWEPPIGGQSPILMPLHPYWGKNRSFVEANSILPITKILPFSKDTTSEYYKQFKQVYEIQKHLNQEQKEIANWWGDDPAFTTAPPGHAYNIAYIILNEYPKDLVTTAMVFAKVGIASADAFINCWKNKYIFHSERPKNYINLNIDKNFVQYWPEPPFPGFPSGHSTQMSATVEVLISIFGDNIAFTDNTHQGRKKDIERNVEYKNRHYTKISQIAEECGISRLYGGIHTMQDNLIGLEEGKKIGRNVNQIKWKKE